MNLLNQKFKIIVSKGQEIVKMPKVVGLKRDEAINALRDAKLESEVKEEYSDADIRIADTLNFSSFIAYAAIKAKEQILKGIKEIRV